MASADPAHLEARVRAAELALAAHYGRTLVEHVVESEAGFGPGSMKPGSMKPGAMKTVHVRIVEYPPVDGSAPGAELPPILMLHGIASTAALMIPLLPSLRDRRVLAIDWPGHGLSGGEVLDSDSDLRDRLNGVIGLVLHRFQLEQVDIIGHSLGGQAALAFAVAKPRELRKLVLLGAPGAAFSHAHASFGMRLAAVPGVGTALLGLSTSARAHRRAVERVLGAGVLDGYPAEIAEIGYLTSQRPEFASSVASLFRSMMTPFAIRPGVAMTAAELAHLAVPTLVIWGTDDAILGPAHGRARAEAIPNASILEIEGGHAPWLNDLARVGDAVAAFVD